MRKIVPKSILHNRLKVHDDGIEANNEERHKGQLHLHVSETVVFSDHIFVPLRFDDLLRIDARETTADCNACDERKKETGEKV